MKEILIFIFLVFAHHSYGQTVNIYTDTINIRSYCNIQPVIGKIGDVDSVRQLSITYQDNQVSVIVYYLLVANSGVMVNNAITLFNSDYTNWNHSDAYLYNYIAHKLGLIILP